MDFYSLCFIVSACLIERSQILLEPLSVPFFVWIDFKLFIGRNVGDTLVQLGRNIIQAPIIE